MAKVWCRINSTVWIPVTLVLGLIGSFLYVLPAFSGEPIRSPSKRVQLYGESVIVTGRWNLQKASSIKRLEPINTVQLFCDKHSMSCQESTAVLTAPMGEPPARLLDVLTLKYKIIKWSDGIVLARFEGFSADIDLRISLPDEFAERTFRETKARGSKSANPNLYARWILE